jgi:hypothetical protein
LGEVVDCYFKFRSKVNILKCEALETLAADAKEGPCFEKDGKTFVLKDLI